MQRLLFFFDLGTPDFLKYSNKNSDRLFSIFVMLSLKSMIKVFGINFPTHYG